MYDNIDIASLLENNRDWIGERAEKMLKTATAKLDSGIITELEYDTLVRQIRVWVDNCSCTLSKIKSS
jgi:hypothetical protein